MSLSIPARPTIYRGVQMRSRLEASWAAHFDELGLVWTYEPVAFGGRGGQYLPDFLLEHPNGDRAYAEIKPTLEAAYRALPRMAIVWESEPDAELVMYVAGAGFYRGLRGRWRWWPSDPDLREAIIARRKAARAARAA